MKNIAIILLTIYSIKLMECFKATDFCQRKEIKGKKSECHGNFQLSCDNNFCAKDQSNCKNFILFRTLKNLYKYEKDFIIFENKYKTFLGHIADCPQPKVYKWNSNDFCLNSKDCVTTFMKLWSFNQIKESECKCKGKHSFRCNTDYCALNKQTCDGLKNQKSKKEIKKCA